MIRAIIFDFDGVILDSVDIKTKAFARLFEEYGPATVDKVVRYHLDQCGVSRFRKFEHIYRSILCRPLPAEESKRLGERFSTLVFDEVARSPWIPGALEFLGGHYKNFQFFVASGTPQEELDRIIHYRQLEPFFAGVFGSPITKDDIIRRILQTHGIKNEETVFVGDAMSDLEAAEACSIQFIGIESAKEKVFPVGTTILPNMLNLGHIIENKQS